VTMEKTPDREISAEKFGEGGKRITGSESGTPVDGAGIAGRKDGT